MPIRHNIALKYILYKSSPSYLKDEYQPYMFCILFEGHLEYTPNCSLKYNSFNDRT